MWGGGPSSPQLPVVPRGTPASLGSGQPHMCEEVREHRTGASSLQRSLLHTHLESPYSLIYSNNLASHPGLRVRLGVRAEKVLLCQPRIISLIQHPRCPKAQEVPFLSAQAFPWLSPPHPCNSAFRSRGALWAVLAPLLAHSSTSQAPCV